MSKILGPWETYDDRVGHICRYFYPKNILGYAAAGIIFENKYKVLICGISQEITNTHLNEPFEGTLERCKLALDSILIDHGFFLLDSQKLINML